MARTIRIGTEAAASRDSHGAAPEAPLPAASDKQKKRSARRCPACDKCFSGEVRFCPFDGDALIDAPDWNPNADPLIGQVIDSRYEILSVMGEGGTGSVYEVRHTTLGRRFALKVLRPDIARDAQVVTRFIQEAKAAAAIGHPNIVAVSDFGEVQPDRSAPLGSKVPYFVMELLTGTSLANLLRNEQILTPDRAAAIGLQCALGLAAAHEAGVIHRDLKPDNVFLVRSGDREFVKLLDFGLAKIAGTSRVTRQGIIFGTPHYMSPEQAMGQPVDHRTDIYALGVILYECLTGRVPFEADSFKGVLDQHINGSPVPLEQRVQDPASLGPLTEIIGRCLEKNPADRYATMAEVAAALEEAMPLIPGTGDADAGLVAPGPRVDPREPAVAASPARGPLVVVLAAATVIALGVVAWLAIQPPPGKTQPVATNQQPVATTPVATTPVATTPVATTPVATAPVATTPVATTPAATQEPVPTAPGTPQTAPVVTGVRPTGTKTTSTAATTPTTAATPTATATATTKKKAGGGGEVIDPWGGG